MKDKDAEVDGLQDVLFESDIVEEKSATTATISPYNTCINPVIISHRHCYAECYAIHILMNERFLNCCNLELSGVQGEIASCNDDKCRQSLVERTKKIVTNCADNTGFVEQIASCHEVCNVPSRAAIAECERLKVK